ncbi:MAG: PLD-like domain, partial [Candidatus Eremiobacteraeota bacterium]|nr:PLD-like domain [Candidatus Eremiobacteraeota bacterium]
GQRDPKQQPSLRKADALDAEARLLDIADAGTVRVASESFGSGTPVYERLLRLKRSGRDVELLLSRSEYEKSAPEREAVSRLAETGVEVRLSSTTEKIAIVGTTVWVGSANATAGSADQPGFGFIIADKPVAERFSDQFDRAWSMAQ